LTERGAPVTVNPMSDMVNKSSFDAARLRSLADIAIFAALVVIGAKLSFSFPFTPVPVTAQVLFVLLAGLVLGARKGFLALLVYLVLGAAGLPVFSKGGGLAYLMGPTGGFLLSFPLAAAAAGAVYRRFGKTVLGAALGCLAGLVLIYVFGALQLAIVMKKGFYAALTLAVFPFVLADLFKAALAVAAARILGVRESF